MTEPGLQIVWQVFKVLYTSNNRKITNVHVLIQQ